MRSCLFVFLLAFSGCAQGGGDGDDAGTVTPADTGTVRDAGGRDAGPTTMRDSGPPPIPDAGPPRLPDAGTPFDAGGGSGDGGGVDAGGFTTCTPEPTNIEITEVMVASQSGAGDRGEWLEIRNLTSCPIDLTGLEIQASGSHVMTSGLLTAGGVFVLSQSTDSVENHGLSTDYAYGTSVRMSNSGGTVRLVYSGTEVARVTWGSTDHRTTASRQLSMGTTMSPAIGGAGWCDSTNVYSSEAGGPYLGTPARINDACP